MSESLNLFRLQNLDTQIDKITMRLEEIDQLLSDNQRVRLAENNLEKARAAAKRKRIELQQIEGKVEAKRIKRKTTQASLYSGKIKNPKELQDLQMESEALKKYIAELEDEQLEAMIASELAEKTEKQAEKALQQAKGNTIEEKAELKGEKNKLQDNLERLLREKEAVLQSISPKALKLYNNLRKKKRGIAVAVVSEGGCSVCGQALPPGDLQAVRAASKLLFCPSCGRILFGGS
jgi:predicted  nucleic acid-binding Zn-ribbon protein